MIVIGRNHKEIYQWQYSPYSIILVYQHIILYNTNVNSMVEGPLYGMSNFLSLGRKQHGHTNNTLSAAIKLMRIRQRKH